MNISRNEQRVLHALAQGGMIRHLREGDRIVAVECFNREGYRLAAFAAPVFNKLRRRGFIASCGGQPYRITRHGLGVVRAQLDNR